MSVKILTRISTKKELIVPGDRIEVSLQGDLLVFQGDSSDLVACVVKGDWWSAQVEGK